MRLPMLININVGNDHEVGLLGGSVAVTDPSLWCSGQRVRVNVSPSSGFDLMCAARLLRGIASGSSNLLAFWLLRNPRIMTGRA